jgi:hypothetical protein
LYVFSCTALYCTEVTIFFILAIIAKLHVYFTPKTTEMLQIEDSSGLLQPPSVTAPIPIAFSPREFGLVVT